MIDVSRAATVWCALAWIMRERTPLTPALSLLEGEGVVAVPSPPHPPQRGGMVRQERVRVSGRVAGALARL